jgi:hypothetical protein
MSVSHLQFYLEPEIRNIDLEYTADDNFSVQHFTSFPQLVAFFLPHDVFECDVVAELGSSVPSTDEAEVAVSVPLTVEGSNGVYLRTVEDTDEYNRLDVPPGEYDLVVRIYPSEKKNVTDDDSYPVKNKGVGHEMFIDHCKVALTFLPKGTVGARVLKSYHEEMPDRIALHRNDGSINFVPNGETPHH